MTDPSAKNNWWQLSKLMEANIRLHSIKKIPRVKELSKDRQTFRQTERVTDAGKTPRPYWHRGKYKKVHT